MNSYSRRRIYLALSSLVVLALTLAVTTCGGEKFSPTPAAPSLTHATAANAGMAAGYGTCQFSVNTTSINVGPNGTDGDLHVTVIPGTNPIPGPGDLDPCPWQVQGPPWFLLKPTQTDKGPILYNDEAFAMPSGSATIKYHVMHGSLDKSDYWKYPGVPFDVGPGEGPIACTAYQASDYDMNPKTVNFDYAGGTGPTIEIYQSQPKTREGYVVITAQTTADSGAVTHKDLFKIPVTQTGSTCEWYLEATPESDWISITGDGKGQGAGTASFSVSAGDVSTTGSLAPRDGVITLYHVATQIADPPDPAMFQQPSTGMPPAPPIGPDINMGTLDVNQLGEPANDDVPECSYNYAISQSEFDYSGGTAQLTVTASSQTCEWRINNWTVPGAWIHVFGCGQGCSGDQQLNVEVAHGDQYSPPVPRSSTIIIDKKVGGTFEQMFAVPISQVRSFNQ